MRWNSGFKDEGEVPDHCQAREEEESCLRPGTNCVRILVATTFLSERMRAVQVLWMPCFCLHTHSVHIHTYASVHVWKRPFFLPSQTFADSLAFWRFVVYCKHSALLPQLVVLYAWKTYNTRLSNESLPFSWWWYKREYGIFAKRNHRTRGETLSK